MELKDIATMTDQEWLEHLRDDYQFWKRISIIFNILTIPTTIPLLLWVFWPSIFPIEFFNTPMVILFCLAIAQLPVNQLRVDGKTRLERWEGILNVEQ
jgi:hypothetical protein